MGEPGFPVYAVGAVYPRTAVGRALWRAVAPAADARRAAGPRRAERDARARVGLPPLDHVHGGTSRQLALVATFPQLEYPRSVSEPWLRVTGPLLWEQPFGEVELPPGDEPLVLVAPSTSQDPEHRLLRATLEGLAGEPRPRARHDQPPAAGAARSTCPRTRDWSTGSPTRARCRAARPWSATRGTAPWSGRSRAGLRWWPARTPATWPRTPRGCAGRAWACRCRDASTRRAGCGWRYGRLLATPATPSGRASVRDWCERHDGARGRR